jgi:hypothetical protein
MNTNWRPNQKLACYVVQAVVITFVGQATLVSQEMVSKWGYWDWSIFAGTIILPGLNAWRAFVDQSKQRQDAENLSNGVPKLQQSTQIP